MTRPIATSDTPADIVELRRRVARHKRKRRRERNPQRVIYVRVDLALGSRIHRASQARRQTINDFCIAALESALEPPQPTAESE